MKFNTKKPKYIQLYNKILKNNNLKNKNKNHNQFYC